MPDKFIKLTWQQVVSAVVVMLFVSAVSWMGATIGSKVKKVEDLEKRLILVEAFVSNEYIKDLGYVKEQVSSINMQMGSYDANQRRMEIVMGRLEAIVERLEKGIR